MRTKTLPKKPNIKPGVFFIPNGKAELSNSSSLLRCYVNFRGSVTYLITHLRIGFEADSKPGGNFGSDRFPGCWWFGMQQKNSSIRVRLIMAAATIISYCLAWFDWWLTGCFGWDWRIRGPPYRVCFIFGEQAGNGKKTQPRPQEDTPPEKLRWLSGWKIMISNKEE